MLGQKVREHVTMVVGTVTGAVIGWWVGPAGVAGYVVAASTGILSAWAFTRVSRRLTRPALPPVARREQLPPPH